MRNWKDVKASLKSTSKEKQYVLDLMSTIIGTIIIERKKLGLTQKDLAEMADLPEFTIVEMENWDNTPNINIVLKVAATLDLKYNFKQESP